MRTGYMSCLLFTVSLLVPALSIPFSLQECYIGYNFFEEWDFETIDDPTNGRVNYVDMKTAIKSNLSFATDSKFFMQPDSTNVVPKGSRGRDSIRLISKAAYADSVIILDLEHMPWGCATWPAFWTLTATGPWPQGGEIDIIEGVNQFSENLVSLHTSPNCSMPQSRDETGVVASTNCDATVNYNQGCGTNLPSPASYGEGFNEGGGGYYALSRAKGEGISVWFWPRTGSQIPPDVEENWPMVDPSQWGTPGAYFPTNSNQCDYKTHFDAHNIIFDLTFCGDWAGTVWSSSGCGSETCVDYVDNNPEKFQDAYWEVNSLRVYTPLW